MTMGGRPATRWRHRRGCVRLGGNRVPRIPSTLARRITLAWLGIALWLGGVELMPNLHLAMHAHLKAHVHDGDRTIFLHHHDAVFVEHVDDDDLDAEVDEHGHVVPAHEDLEATPHELSHAEHELALRLEHGGHALAHHALALPPAPPPALAPMPFHRCLPEAPDVAIIEPRSWSVPDAAARGPPSLFA
ncbi:hypothetical protein BH11MYX1_BH11MYX1_46970 [soil metagenome]